MQLGREHSDNSVAFIIERQFLSDYMWISAKAALPEVVTEHRHLIVIGSAFFGQEAAPSGSIDSEQRQNISSDNRPTQPEGIGRAGKVKTRGLKGPNSIEDVVTSLHIKEISR